MKSLLIITVLIVLLTPLTQAAQKVILKTEIKNESWFPLTREEMRASASDSALHEISRFGTLEFTEPSTEVEKLGELSITVTLVEAAESVTVTVEFRAPGQATQVTRSSSSIKGLDHQQIFNTFVKTGHQAGQEMGLRLGDKVDKPMTTETSSSASKKLFEEAQNLKRAGQFQASKAQFLQLIHQSVETDKKWADLAEDQLRYDLPRFEALQLQNQVGGSAQSPQTASRLRRIEALYRFIIAENQENTERVSEANRALDSLAIMKAAIRQAHQANMKAFIHQVTVALQVYFAEYGQPPQKVEELLRMSQSSGEYQVRQWKSQAQEYQFEAVDTENGIRALIKGRVFEGRPKIDFQ